MLSSLFPGRPLPTTLPAYCALNLKKIIFIYLFAVSFELLLLCTFM